MAYLTANERIKIEYMLEDGYSQREIAKRLGRHYNTIYKEIKRGLVTLRDGRTWLDYTVYKADVGQRIQQEHAANKGAPLKIGNDMEFVRFVEHMVLDKKYSPYAVLQAARGKYRTQICKTTLYKYIDMGLFMNVTNKDLPVKKDAPKNAHEPVRAAYNNRRGKSIEERPKAVNKRNSFGHWELDTVVGGRGKSSQCLLVLTERKTRYEIIMKLADKTMDSVVKAFHRLEDAYGLEAFKERFKTITADNGTEFFDSVGIEQSPTGEQRTTLYYCHPYCPSERGTNENTNKLIRRHCPKGCDFADYSDEDMQNVQDWVNNYPRKLFGGKSASDMLP